MASQRVWPRKTCTLRVLTWVPYDHPIFNWRGSLDLLTVQAGSCKNLHVARSQVMENLRFVWRMQAGQEAGWACEALCGHACGHARAWHRIDQRPRRERARRRGRQPPRGRPSWRRLRCAAAAARQPGDRLAARPCPGRPRRRSPGQPLQL